MNSMNSLTHQLRSLRLRPPSRRLSRRLFGHVASGWGQARPGPPRVVWPLAVTAAASLMLAAWVVREMPAGVQRALAPDVAAANRALRDPQWSATQPPGWHSARNAAPRPRLEWTNTGPFFSSMPSLSGWRTNRSW